MHGENQGKTPGEAKAHRPLVSIIMNCFNGERYLREAVKSVYAQTYSDWEIVFWDNASTDDSPSIANSYDSKLRYFRGERTISLGAARNKAIDQARGEFIAFLDCDDRWLSRKLEMQIPLFGEPGVGIVFSDAFVFNHSKIRTRFYETMPYATGQCFRQLLREYFLCLSTVIIRRSALDEDGECFDTRFEICEEADAFIRIARCWNIAMVRDPLAEYRLHSGSSTWSKGYLVADEVDLLLEKLAEDLPELWTEYGQEAAHLRMNARLRKASYCLRTGDRHSARCCTYPYVLKSMRALQMFIAAFLPRGIFNALRRCYLRGGVTAENE